MCNPNDKMIGLAQVPMYLSCEHGMWRTRATIYNWVKVGIDVHGERVRLKTHQRNGKLLTTPLWVEEFLNGTFSELGRAGVCGRIGAN